MKSIEKVKDNNRIKIVDDRFQKIALGGLYCPCRVWVEDMSQHVVAAHFIEVIHP